LGRWRNRGSTRDAYSRRSPPRAREPVLFDGAVTRRRSWWRPATLCHAIHALAGSRYCAAERKPDQRTRSELLPEAWMEGLRLAARTRRCAPDGAHPHCRRAALTTLARALWLSKAVEAKALEGRGARVVEATPCRKTTVTNVERH